MCEKKLKYLYAFCIFVNCTLVSCGGGTMGSSSTGGVTIKGQARVANSNTPISNSPMSVLDSRGEAEVLKSETDSLGMFNMTLAKSNQAIILDIEKASSGVLVTRDLLLSDEVSLSILDNPGVITNIEYFLGLQVQTKGQCVVKKDSSNSSVSINLETVNANCRIKIKGIFGGDTEQGTASVFKCQEIIGEISSGNQEEYNIDHTDAICDQNDIEVEFETLKINIKINRASNTKTYDN